jgi:hypothetical protein
MMIWTPHPARPSFCKQCGQPLKPNRSISHYNELTGEPVRPWEHLPICSSRSCPAKLAQPYIDWAGRYP